MNVADIKFEWKLTSNNNYWELFANDILLPISVWNIRPDEQVQTITSQIDLKNAMEKAVKEMMCNGLLKMHGRN